MTTAHGRARAGVPGPVARDAPVVDSHQHFLDPGRAHYPWLTEEYAAVDRSFGPADLRPALAAAGVGWTVLVQTRSSLEETGELLDLAARTDFVAGVVGWVDLTAPGVADTLAELEAGPGGGLLVGIRHQVHDEEDPAWLLRPDVDRGLRAVGKAGLAYDLLVRARELPAALAVVRRHGGTRFVVDHLAKPPIASRASGDFSSWAAALALLAAEPNVTCKLSGMVTEADWRSWSAADLAPYVDAVLGWFGGRRVLFGSDWPLCLVAASYETVKATLESLIRGLCDEERAAVMGGTAAEVYGLVP